MHAEHSPEQFAEVKGNPSVEHVKELVAEIYGGSPEKYGRMVKFARKLQSKYPDVKRRKLYHAMIGSSVEEMYDIDEDFPGEDSIVTFLENLAHEQA